MSAQAGVFHFDGRPIAPEAPRRLQRALAPFGPDRGGEYVAPGLAMVHRALHVTPEDLGERQPFISALGHVLTWDGRLDNREDLRLQLWRELGDDLGDAALAMAVFERWGIQGFAKLIGDWSLALWDATTRTLHLASDYMGVRPLYYAADADGVRWSSTLGTLVRPIRDIGDIEPRFVVGFLTFAMPPEVTPYPGVRSVPPAHVVSWSASGTQTRTRYWSLSPARVRDAAPHACAEQLRHLLADAVRGRLRSIRPVWAELSGGLDSSTIVCLAHALLAQGVAPSPALRTISYVSDSSRESDERPFIAAVETAIGRSGLHLRAEDCIGAVDCERGWVTPFHVTDTGLEMLRSVRREGGRTVLSGSAGDLFMGNAIDNSLAALDELLLHWRPAGFIRELRAWSKATRKTIWHLAWRMLSLFAPERIRVSRALWHALTHHGHMRGGTLEAGAAELFLLRAGAIELWKDEVVRRARLHRAFRSAPHLPLLEGIEQLSHGRALPTSSEFPGVSVTFPYVHRPLVELVTSMPSRVLCAPGRPRALMHEAVDILLPEKIRRRFSKGYAAPLLARSSQRFARRYRGNAGALGLVRGGYVDAARLEAMLARLDHGACKALHNLPRIVVLERWLEMSRQAPDTRAQIPA
ncbi:MAG TPA: asparagine synthetase B [Vicinamibacterales bacterium]